MEYLSHELVTFEKCIANELGPDMVKHLKNHYIITYGQLKPAIDYMFSNLYSEKSAKLVSLNLKADNINNAQNQSQNAVKLKNLELKKKLNDYKSSLKHEQSEITNLTQNIQQMQKKLNKSKNDLLNKQSNSFKQDKLVKEVEHIATTIKESIKHLDFINNTATATNVETINKTDHNESSFYFNDKLNLTEALEIATNQTSDECLEIDKITDTFNSELQLILYRIESCTQLSDMNTAQTNVNIFDRVNELYFELITRNCEKSKFKRETDIFSKKINDLRPKISEFLKRNYTKDSMLYGQYLKSYFMYKSAESNLNELCCIQTFENEINQMNTNTSFIESKQKQLNDLDTNIHFKQLQLNDLFQENITKLVKLLPVNNKQMKSNTETLLDLIQSFNSCTNSQLSSNILAEFNQQNAQNKIEIYKYKEEQLIDSSLLKNSCFTFNDLNSQHCLFDKFLQMFTEIKFKLVEIDKSHKNVSRTIHIKQLVNDLKTSLTKCKQIEKNELYKYVNLFEQKSDSLEQFKQELVQLEKLVDTWQTQPGAYECIFDEITHKSKRLDYYVNCIDEAIANYERRKINQQIMN